jgi:hypothetical protein
VRPPSTPRARPREEPCRPCDPHRHGARSSRSWRGSCRPCSPRPATSRRPARRAQARRGRRRRGPQTGSRASTTGPAHPMGREADSQVGEKAWTSFPHTSTPRSRCVSQPRPRLQPPDEAWSIEHDVRSPQPRS